MKPPDSALVEAGWFWMGSEGHYSWESPRHRVFVSAFEIARTPVTRADYGRFLAETGHPEPRGWGDPLFADPQQPAVGISWFDAAAYCVWLSRTVHRRYRLPTEAEWEKACRGGVDDADYAWGNDAPDTLAYFQGVWDRPRPVAAWPPNPFGIYNLGDNVHEWCSDWYDPAYYAVSPPADPQGPESGRRKASRGGSWRHQVKGSRAAHRSSLPPDYGYTDYGLRVVLDLARPESSKEPPNLIEI